MPTGFTNGAWRQAKAPWRALEGYITRLITNVIVDKGIHDHDEILDRYIKLMTKPDAHNETYAGTGHRMFFANYANGKTRGNV